MAADAANQALSQTAPRTLVAESGQPNGQDPRKGRTHPASAPADRTYPDGSGTNRLATTAGPSGVFVPDRCPGPAGTWPCALEFGHGGDHERFLSEPPLGAVESEVLEGVRRLRSQRDDLLMFVRQAQIVALLRPHDGSQLDEDLEGLLIDARRLLEDCK